MPSVYQTNINTITSVLYQQGIRDVIICPGSRSAPLVMSFVRHGGFRCLSVPDERSAAFIGMGMARQQQHPVALLCTSGTAILNFYPAIAEAFYGQVPLVVITADRPPEMIDRWDGQTIRQFEVYKNHILGTFETPDNLDDLQVRKTIGLLVHEAVRLCMAPVPGPVHINVPLRDPIYRDKHDAFEYPDIALTQVEEDIEAELEMAIDSETFFSDYKQILVLNGAGMPDAALHEAVKKLSDKHYCVVLSDIISNLHSAGNIDRWDGLASALTTEQKQRLKPDLLITTGTYTLSKGLKLFLRDFPPREHWHITANGYHADPFFTLTRVIEFNVPDFLTQFNAVVPDTTSDYYLEFSRLSRAFSGEFEELALSGFNEFSIVRNILQALPSSSILHLANSMAIRYASYWGIKDNSVTVYSNRGTSGIDGCTSAAVGAAIAQPDKTVVLITGDVAFLYDINAFWNDYLPPNLKIVVLNNYSGSIFRFIDAGDIPELDPYFETPHKRTAKSVADMFHITCYEAADTDTLTTILPLFCQHQGTAILEIHTDNASNAAMFSAFKSIRV